MKAKQLVCNDCGCRFEIKNPKEAGSQAAGKDKTPESGTGSSSPSCPECRSYNLTTA